MSSPTSDFFASTAPGLEAYVTQELQALGIAAETVDGGAVWSGSTESLYRAALHLRLASRIVVRAGAFGARGFAELERHARRIDWQRFLAPGVPVRLRVTARKSRLYHEGAIAERLLGVIGRPAATGPANARAAGGRDSATAARAASGPVRANGDDEEPDDNAQLIVVRFLRDRCTISVDAAGALLHRRGYRQELGKAPLRETLAAAMLHVVAPASTVPLLDPLCGSGTILIEAALRARHIPPGLAGADREPRAFAFQRWPDFDAPIFQRVCDRARGAILPAAPAPILGSDRDAGAVAAARANAARAGVDGDIEIEQRPLTDARLPPDLAGRGVLLTNPPYGVRVGDRQRLRDLYAALGNLARDRLPGWTIAMLCADRRLCGQSGLAMRSGLATRNGGIPVELLVHDGAPSRLADVARST